MDPATALYYTGHVDDICPEAMLAQVAEARRQRPRGHGLRRYCWPLHRRRRHGPMLHSIHDNGDDGGDPPSAAGVMATAVANGPASAMAWDTVVLTAPHALCPSPGCDPLSGRVVQRIRRRWPDVGSATDRPKLQVFDASQAPWHMGRGECDLNRAWCRGTPYRRDLTEAIRRATRDGTRNVFVLDVHSYASDTPDRMARQWPTGDRRPWSAFDGVILDGAGGPDLRSTTEALVRTLTRARLSIGVVTNIGGVNDIMEEARALGAHATLLECNEALGSKRARAQRFAPFISATVRWLRGDA